ncbi:MAG: PspA-associated protein PspAB [Acidimicrobiales bacterium]
MGLLDTLLGRTKLVRANLDALFALPSAAVTLQASSGLLSTGRAGVCFKPPAGQPFEQMQAELEQLLRFEEPGSTPPDPASAPSGPVGTSSGTASAPTVRHVGDRYGYRWILVEGGAIDDLVTRVHMVHSSLEDAGWSTQLLCSVFGFAPLAPGTPDTATVAAPGGGASSGSGADQAGEGPDDSASVVARPLYIVYLAKRGTFYPFAPSGGEQRDTELELRIRSVLGTDLPVEPELARWFPIWDLPIS